jgi:hypothetical protein
LTSSQSFNINENILKLNISLGVFGASNSNTCKLEDIGVIECKLYPAGTSETVGFNTCKDCPAGKNKSNRM